MAGIQKITRYLWFNGNAEEAVEFYTSLFPDSRVTTVARWGEGGPGRIQKIDLDVLRRAHVAA